jgi:hypothetical protein
MGNAAVYIIMISLFMQPVTPGDAGGNNTGQGAVRIVYPDGSRYLGHIRDGRRDGQGRYLLADGSEYRGEFREGKPHGSGIYFYADGRRKKVVHEAGRLIQSWFMEHDTTKEGCQFGEFTGPGRYTGWFRGNRIKGYVPHGRGIMRYRNGSVYTGQWKNGKMHGNGTIRWNDGTMYSGQWKMGKRTGFGTYIWPGGDKYVGQWNDNQICGTGTYYYQNGRVVSGEWKEAQVRVDE